MSTKRKIFLSGHIVQLTHLFFVVGTVQCPSISSVVSAARFFSQSVDDAHYYYYCIYFWFTHHVTGIFSFTICLLSLFSTHHSCHVSYFIFNGRSRTKPLMLAPNTHTHTNTSFYALWQLFFACQTHIFITMLWKSNFKCEKNSTFSFTSVSMFKSKSSCGWQKI